MPNPAAPAAGRTRPPGRGRVATDTMRTGRIDVDPLSPNLDDASVFAVRRSVPILDVHEHPTKGKVDVATLQRLARNSNARSDRGDHALTLIGHTTDDGPEESQPPIAGFLKAFAVKKYRGRPTLHADFHFYKSQLKHALTFPHRSVERVEADADADNYIEAVALLRRAPERHLGLLTHGRSGNPNVRVVRYSRDLPPIGSGGGRNPRPAKDEPMPLAPPVLEAPPVPAINEQFMQVMKDAMKEVLMSFMGGDGDPIDAGPLPGPSDLGSEDDPTTDEPDLLGEVDGSDLDGDGDGDLDLDGDGDADLADEEIAAEDDLSDGADDDLGPPPEDEEEDLDGDGDGDVVVKKHGMAEPCSTNTFVPGVVGKKKTKHARTSDGNTTLIRYQRALAEKDAVIARKDATIVDLQKKNEAIKVRYRRDSKRRGVLAGLEAEGYMLDVNEELKDTAAFDDARFAAHVGKVRTRYNKVPLGGKPVPTGEPDDLSDEDPETPMKIVRYAHEKKEVDGRKAVHGFLADFNQHRIGGVQG